jgi:succinyl-CoA synthetase beta subunit
VARLPQHCSRTSTTAYKANDASLTEINPLIITGEGKLMALDGKFSVDDNALSRQPRLAEMRDVKRSRWPKPRRAEPASIKLEGDIGCMVNGAGLAMATMDILKHFGGQPANFLDVGGSATTEKVTEAFRILVGDQVKAIFVNIFGGIMKCDTIANGLVEAARVLSLDVPLIVRLEGTNVELGKQILRDSGLAITPADSMADGAQKAVAAVAGAC